MQHSARLAVKRPEWVTYDRGDLLQRSGNGSQRVTDPGWHPHPGLYSWRDASAMAKSVGGRELQG